MSRHWLDTEEQTTFCGKSLDDVKALHETLTSTPILVTCKDCYASWTFRQSLRHVSVDDFKDVTS